MLIIDAGSRGLAEYVGTKGNLRETMHKLWKWSEKEIKASPTRTRDLWRDQANGTTLEDITRHLDMVLQSSPYLTTISEVPTTDIDQQIISRREMARISIARLHSVITRKNTSTNWTLMRGMDRRCVE